ncbi:MAG: hypothetical protein ACLQLH_12770 [Terracidiphilus sp.]
MRNLSLSLVHTQVIPVELLTAIAPLPDLVWMHPLFSSSGSRLIRQNSKQLQIDVRFSGHAEYALFIPKELVLSSQTEQGNITPVSGNFISPIQEFESLFRIDHWPLCVATVA